MAIVPPRPAPPSPVLDPSLRQLAKILIGMQEKIDRIERGQRTHQLDQTSIENAQIPIYDNTGTLRAILGQQDDGTFGHQHYNGSTPLAPSVPLVVPGISNLTVAWDGSMSDGNAPLSDFDHLQVHLGSTSNFTPTTATVAATLPKAGTVVLGGLAAGTTLYVAFVAINTSGIASPASTFSSATPASVVSSIPAGAIQATQLGFSARTIGGITTTIQPVAPNSPNIGDLWYDTSNNNLLNVWNGSAWVPYQFGTNAIAVGSITAQLIAAGTIIAGSVDGTTITGATLIATGTSGEILAYNGVPAAGNLVLAVSPVAGSDSFGNSYFAGVTTYNGFGAVVNLLSTDHAAFFQYFNHASAVQGSLILSVASTSGTDPVTAQSYSAGLQGIDPVFGDFMTSTGANINLGIGTVITRSAGIHIQQAPSNSQNPYLKVDAPEETTATHAQLLLQGASPDGTQLGQFLFGQVSGASTLAPVTNAMVEIQGQVTGTSPILQLLAQAAGANSFGIEVTGDGFNRIRIDSNGKITEGPGNATQDVNLYRAGVSQWQTDDSLAFTNSSAPTAIASASAVYASSGQLATVNPQGLNHIVQTANRPALNANTVTQATLTSLSSVVMPAGEGNVVSATWKFILFGYGTWGSTQQALTFGIRFGAAATNTIGTTPTVGATALPASSAFQWSVTITLTLVSNPGLTTATWRASMEGVLGNNSVAFVGGTGSTDVTLDASIAETFGLSANWASTTGAPTITKTFAQFERTA